MENPEEILQALDQFSRLKPKEIPTELEEYLRFVAKAGDPVYQWTLIKPLYTQKLNNVITEFFESSPILEIPSSPNVEPFNYERMKTSLLERLETFMNAPFTIQRISELLVSPRSEYNRIDKYMRAVEKNVLVVSTRDTTLRSHLDNDKNQEAVNGIPENNGTAEDVDVNMLNSELGLQHPAPPPTDELLDIKADELEMDSLLIENMPDDKWVKTDNITSDINSVVSMAAEMTSQSAVEMSTDIDLGSTESNSMAETSQPLPVQETIPESSVEPMCIEPHPGINEPISTMTELVPSMAEPVPAMTEPVPNLAEPVSTLTESAPTLNEPMPSMVESVPSMTEPITEEPMSIEPPIETAPIEVNEPPTESVDISNTLAAESISMVTEEQPVLHTEPTTIDSCTPDSHTAAEKMNLLSNESLPSEQESAAGEVTSSLNVLLADGETAEPNSLIKTQGAECGDAKDESEMLIESSTDAKAIQPDVPDSSEAQATVSATLVENPTTSSSIDCTTSKEGVSTTTAESATEDAKLPIVTLPEDESSNEAPAPTTSEPSDNPTSSNPTEDILVTLLADNESLGSTDEVIAPTPVVTEPQEVQEMEEEQATTSTSEEVTEV